MRIKWNRSLDVRQQTIPEQQEPQSQAPPAAAGSSASSSVSDLRGKKHGIFNFWRSFRKKNHSSRFAGFTDDTPVPSDSSRRLTWSGADPRANRRLIQADRLLTQNNQEQQQLSPTLAPQQFTNGERTINIFQESFNQHNRSESCSLQPVTSLQAQEREENGSGSSNQKAENENQPQASRVTVADGGVTIKQHGGVETNNRGTRIPSYCDRNINVSAERQSFRNKDSAIKGLLLSDKKQTITAQNNYSGNKEDEEVKPADLNVKSSAFLDNKLQCDSLKVDFSKVELLDEESGKSDQVCSSEQITTPIRHYKKESRIPISDRHSRTNKLESAQYIKIELNANDVPELRKQDGQLLQLQFVDDQIGDEDISMANGASGTTAPQTPTTPVGARNVSAGRPVPIIRSSFTSSSPLVIPSSSRQQRQKLEELWREVQHLGALCESRTKELNRVKMQLKHAASGFDAFATLVQYLAGELNAFSHPDLISEIQTTKEQLITLESFLKQCEGDLEGMRERHAEEVSLLTKQLQQAQEDTSLLQEKLENAEKMHLKQCEEWELEKERALKEAVSRQQAALEITQAQHASQVEALNKDHEDELKACEERHKVEQEALQGQLDLMKERCRKLQEQATSIEEALQQDTNAKVQWLSAKNADLQKEVESLKSVLEMKQEEVHELRKETSIVTKQAEEVTVYRQRVSKLMTRIEELQALLREKSKKERKLSCDQRNLQEHLDKESKINRQLSMEKEELLWRLTESFNNSSGSLNNSLLATPDFLKLKRSNVSTPFRLTPGSLPPFRENLQDEQQQPQQPSGDENLVTSTSSLDSKPHRAKIRVNRTRSCHTSPRDSPSHNSSSRMVVSTPNMPCDDDNSVDDPTSSAKLSPCDSLTELHLKACMQLECIDDILLQQRQQQQQQSYSPNGASSPNSGSVSMTSSAAEDLSLSSNEEERRLDHLTSLRIQAGEAMSAIDEKNREAMATPDSPPGEREEPPSDNNLSTTPCFCDDFDISSEPE